MKTFYIQKQVNNMYSALEARFSILSLFACVLYLLMSLLNYIV